jgi:hypothetical protein
MRYMKPMSFRIAITYGIVLGTCAALGVTPWSLVAAKALAADKVQQQETVDQKEKSGFGRFVSFQDGTLIIEGNSGDLLAWHKVAENTKTSKYDPDTNDYKQVEETAAALSQVKAGTYVMVGERRGFIRIGARHDRVSGTFVSFKNDRLLTLGVNLPESFTKRYGNTLHYNKFRDDVPVHESVDGGEYKLIGTANKVLREVKEGTILCVHGEGDDNITLIQIGLTKKQ